MTEPTTSLRLKVADVHRLLGCVRSAISDYEEALEEKAVDEEATSWYEAELAILQPLERRLNAAGLRLTRRVLRQVRA